jgi:hypothetical protein
MSGGSGNSSWDSVGPVLHPFNEVATVGATPVSQTIEEKDAKEQAGAAAAAFAETIPWQALLVQELEELTKLEQASSGRCSFVDVVLA